MSSAAWPAPRDCLSANRSTASQHSRRSGRGVHHRSEQHHHFRERQCRGGRNHQLHRLRGGVWKPPEGRPWDLGHHRSFQPGGHDQWSNGERPGHGEFVYWRASERRRHSFRRYDHRDQRVVDHARFIFHGERRLHPRVRNAERLLGRHLHQCRHGAAGQRERAQPEFLDHPGQCRRRHAGSQWFQSNGRHGVRRRRPGRQYPIDWRSDADHWRGHERNWRDRE